MGTAGKELQTEGCCKKRKRKENNITLLVCSCTFWIIEEPLLGIRTDKPAGFN